jgi:hypothetical protein
VRSLSVDGSFIMANASHHSRVPREQLAEAARVNYGARKYLEALEQENGDGEPIHQQDKVSTTDPDSTYLTKGNRAAEHHPQLRQRYAEAVFDGRNQSCLARSKSML